MDLFQQALQTNEKLFFQILELFFELASYNFQINSGVYYMHIYVSTILHH